MKSGKEWHKTLRLAIILVFVLAMTSIIVTSGKQLIITKTVDVPVEVEEVVEVPVYITEKNEETSLEEAPEEMVALSIIRALPLMGIGSFGMFVAIRHAIWRKNSSTQNGGIFF